jgi:hypothetical protein
MRMNSVNRGCRDMSGVVDLLRERAEVRDDVHCRRRVTDVDGLYDARRRLHQWTDARNTSQKLPFSPFFETPGATGKCQGSIRKSFCAKHIRPARGVPGRSGSLVRIGAPKVPYRFSLIVHYLMWLRIAPDARSFVLPRIRVYAIVWALSVVRSVAAGIETL